MELHHPASAKENLVILFLRDALGPTIVNYSLFGLGGNDTLSGDDRNDTLDGGAGADTMAGGVGNDIYYVDSTGDVVTEAVGEGTDEVRSTITYALGSNLENLTLLGTDAVNGTGNDGANNINGNQASNVLYGEQPMMGGDTPYRGANDNMYGWAGDDVMVGGIGDDTLHGAEGNDWLQGGDSPVGRGDLDRGKDALYGEAGNDGLDGMGGPT